MRFQRQLPVSVLLFTWNGRISRGTYWTAALFYWCTFYVLYELLNQAGPGATFFLYPILFWTILVTSIKRLHDQHTSGYALFALLLPVVGPLWLFYRLGWKKGDVSTNGYGPLPGAAQDYLVNDTGRELPDGTSGQCIIDDVTKLNPVVVAKVVRPESVAEICEIVSQTPGAISVGGGRFSMGGQTTSPNSVHIDMRGMDRILEFSRESKTIRVEAGIRWCDIQRYIDPFDLSVKTMQTYANFTVGGALSVNAHGRYIGLGPVILSVRSLDIVLADGRLVHATPTEDQEFFFGSIGGYNAIGIIVQVELELAENVLVEREHKKMRVEEYVKYFFRDVRDHPRAIFHNGDLYPPHYTRLRAVTWSESRQRPTTKARLMPLRELYPIERYFLWSFTETPFGKWRREYLIDPLLYRTKKIHWRNYEAGYDAAELEPRSRSRSTYVLQEYFVPITRFEEFRHAMAEIFQRFNVNVLNVSIRHARTDLGSMLAWAREEVFAFVVYYKQRNDPASRNAVAVWTRELIDAVIAVNGTYYLPYQVHATPEQFHRAYPGATTLFELKAKFDPDYKFRNVLWDTYYRPTLSAKHD